MTLEEILESVTMEQRKQLIYSFDNSIPCCVKLDNYFVGVNLNQTGLKIIEQKGQWCLGEK